MHSTAAAGHIARAPCTENKAIADATGDDCRAAQRIMTKIIIVSLSSTKLFRFIRKFTT